MDVLAGFGAALTAFAAFATDFRAAGGAAAATFFNAFRDLAGTVFEAFPSGFAIALRAPAVFRVADFAAETAFPTSFFTVLEAFLGGAAFRAGAFFEPLPLVTAVFAFFGAGFAVALAAFDLAGAFVFVFSDLDFELPVFFFPAAPVFFFDGDAPPDFLPLTVGISSPPILESGTLRSRPKKNGAIYQPSAP